jgi:NAD(P)-dependent dehydrogenase (short-subunit alcohol dehydrogenase family)
MEIIKDKNVLIVGATGGIGKATALLLKQSGANLFITSSNENKLAELSAQLDLPSNQTFLLDITDANAVRNVAENIHQQIPAIDILINAAGIGIIKPIENLTEQDFMQTVQVNLAGAFYLVKNFIEPMKIAKKGLIINIPGVLGKTPMAGAAAYSASKYGLNGMMKSIREELKRTDIRITNIFLGGTDSPFWDHIDLRVQRDKFVQAAEVAKSIWFLCQQPSSGVVSELVLQPFNHQAI